VREPSTQSKFYYVEMTELDTLNIFRVDVHHLESMIRNRYPRL